MLYLGITGFGLHGPLGLMENPGVAPWTPLPEALGETLGFLANRVEGIAGALVSAMIPRVLTGTWWRQGEGWLEGGGENERLV